jgi:hypothetical protein
MKHLALGVALIAAWPSFADAAPLRIAPVESLGAPVEYMQGMAGARSTLAKTDVGLLVERATIDDKDLPALSIAIQNHGQAPFNVTLDSVQVTTQAGERLSLWTRDELVTAVEAQARKREKSARLAASLNALGASMRDTPTRADPRFQARVGEAQADGAAAVAAAAERGFIVQTVHPGEQHVTDLGLGPLPKDVTALTVSVTVAGETHTFPLKVTRLR